MAIQVRKPQEPLWVHRHSTVEGTHFLLRVLHGKENSILYAIGFLIYMGVALYLRHLDLFIADANARTAQAYFVLFSRDPHLAAIGFVWNPLPNLLQLPLVALLQLLRHDTLLAGNVLTALFGAATLVVLNIAMRRTTMPAILRWLLITLFGLNPMVLLYSANGMSEMLFVFAIVLAVSSFIWWVETYSASAFILASLAVTFAVQIRYEAMVVTAVIAFCLIIACMVTNKEYGFRTVWQRVDSHLFLYIVGPIYSFGLWLFFNWTIMGTPLYFLQSVYGNTSQTAQFRSGADSRLNSAIGSVLGTLNYMIERTLWLFPATGVLIVLALFVFLSIYSSFR